MAREATMTKEYTDKATFQTDMQQLGQQGWSVQSTVNSARQSGLLHRLRTFFTRKTTTVHFAVTYSRPRPS